MTSPPNQAVALNADLEYAILQTPHERILLAEGLVKETMGRWGMDEVFINFDEKCQPLSNPIIYYVS